MIMHLLLHILSFLSTPQSQEPLLTRVDIGVSTQPCKRFRYEGDGYLVLVPFECTSLSVLHSLSLSRHLCRPMNGSTPGMSPLF